MNKINLKDFEKWKNLNRNNDFSIFDYIFHVVKSSQISSDIYIAFSKLFWPSFIVYNNYVFLEDNFSEKKFNELINGKENIEFWMNFFNTDPYFDEDEEEGNKKAEALALILMTIWESKLKKDFPNLKFRVEYLHDIKCGDYGLTFYQIL